MIGIRHVKNIKEAYDSTILGNKIIYLLLSKPVLRINRRH